jgi:hypothetical protein
MASSDFPVAVGPTIAIIFDLLYDFGTCGGTMYRNLRPQPRDHEDLIPLAVAAYLLGSGFAAWLESNLDTKWKIYNFGWGDYPDFYLLPIDMVIGGP